MAEVKVQDTFTLSSEESPDVFCAWCGRIQNADGSWMFPVPARMDTPVTHGICPECAQVEASQLS